MSKYRELIDTWSPQVEDIPDAGYNYYNHLRESAYLPKEPLSFEAWLQKVYDERQRIKEKAIRVTIE